MAGLAERESGAAIRTLHHNAQRLLKPVKVVNPYAEYLTFMDDKTRTRRDHRKYLGLIRAIAFLHQYQRPQRQLAGPGGTSIAYIEATPDDIAAANRLAHAVLGTTLDELPPQTRLLLTLIRAFVDERAKTQGITARDVRFTRRELREPSGGATLRPSFISAALPTSNICWCGAMPPGSSTSWPGRAKAAMAARSSWG